MFDDWFTTVATITKSARLRASIALHRKVPVSFMTMKFSSMNCG